MPSITFWSASFPEKDKGQEPPEPEQKAKLFVKLALELGGFDKVRKLTALQASLLAEELVERQLFLARVNGCEIEDKESPEEEFTSFSDAFNALKEG
jgi:hypothetical protein